MRTQRTVVITGGAGGIGSALVRRFIDNGDRVVAADRDGTALGRLGGKGSLADRGSLSALDTLVADVADEASCLLLAKHVEANGGRVDVLIHCAGYFPIQPFESMTAADWNTVVAINLTGPFLVTKALLPLMTGRSWGRIVCIGSASAFEGVPGQVHYVAAKAGVLGFARSLAREVGQHGITVNVVTPGLTSTSPVKDHMPAAMINASVDSRAIKREEAAEDLVGAVFFLASPDADFISGQTINVDGGRHML